MEFSKQVLNIDPAEVTDDLVEFLRTNVRKKMRRYGGVIGISGGVDSSVVLALCVRAFGPNKVAAIMLPEKTRTLKANPSLVYWPAIMVLSPF